MRVVHLQRAHAHESEQLAALLVAITRAVFRQPQRQIAITARHRRKQFVMMRAVHRFEVIAICRSQLRSDFVSASDKQFRPVSSAFVNCASREALEHRPFDARGSLRALRLSAQVPSAETSTRRSREGGRSLGTGFPAQCAACARADNRRRIRFLSRAFPVLR